MPKKIFVTVSGGVAYAVEESVPSGYELEIIDFDNIKEGDDGRSDEAKKLLPSTGDKLNGVTIGPRMLFRAWSQIPE